MLCLGKKRQIQDNWVINKILTTYLVDQCFYQVFLPWQSLFIWTSYCKCTLKFESHNLLSLNNDFRIQRCSGTGVLRFTDLFP